MMRSPKSFVVVVRRPDNNIAVREQQWVTLLPFLTFLRWPVFRGALVLLESLHNGFSALKFSAEHALPEEAEPSKESSSSIGASLMLAIATTAMVALFIAAPPLMTYGVARFGGPVRSTRGVLFEAVEVS